MQKIKFNINAPDSEESEQLLVEQLLKDERVEALLQRYHASRKAVENNPYMFREWLQSLDNNEHKYGSVSLNDSNERYYKDIEIENDVATVLLRKSIRQREEDQKLAFVRNYLICDLSREMLEYDLNKIDLTHENESYQKVYQIIQKWLKQLPEKGLYLWGGLGVGKSYLAACISNQLAQRGHKVAFVNVPNFFAKARSNVGVLDPVSKENFINSSLRRLMKAEFLILDDIGAERVTDWVRDDILAPLLNYRMDNKKSTIFTSNSNFDDLRERLMYNTSGQKDEMKADRIMERIRTLSVEIKLEGSSRRK